MSVRTRRHNASEKTDRPTRDTAVSRTTLSWWDGCHNDRDRDPPTHCMHCGRLLPWGWWTRTTGASWRWGSFPAYYYGIMVIAALSEVRQGLGLEVPKDLQGVAG